MRKLFAFIIVICLLYFLGGYIAVRFGIVAKDDYFACAGIVGGLASVAGLLALTRPAITQSDVQAIEVSALKSMTRTAEELKSLQTARSKTQQEIGGLTEKKKEMELLVRKASLALFLKEQYAYHEREILEEIGKSNHLRIALEKATDASQKLSALNEEIEADPNVRQLQEVIEAASRRQPTINEVIDKLPPFFRSIIAFVEAVSKLVSKAILL